MISTEYLKGFNLKHKKIFSKNIVLSIILCQFFSCSNDYQIKKTSWDSSLDYFSENLEKYEVTYFVDVGTK